MATSSTASHAQPTVFLLDVPEAEVLRRIAARDEGRPDDKSQEIVIDRLREYEEFTAPLINYYEREASLYRVDGTIGVEPVFEWIKNLLESKERIAWG